MKFEHEGMLCWDPSTGCGLCGEHGGELIPFYQALVNAGVDIRQQLTLSVIPKVRITIEIPGQAEPLPPPKVWDGPKKAA